MSLVFAWACYAQAPLEFDQYGGLKSLNFGPGKCFRTHNDGQRWWLVTPDGGAFLSLGVCVLNSNGDVEKGTDRHQYHDNVVQKYGSVENWATVTRERCKEWGINTLGDWSGNELDKMPYTLELGVGSGLWGRDHVPDFFDPAVQKGIADHANGIEKRADDPYLIGYYLDNELPWAYDWRRGPDLFQGYLAMAPNAPGKQKLVEFFKDRYETVDRFNAVWKTALKDWSDLERLRRIDVPENTASAREDMQAFVLTAVRLYFKTAADAIRAKDKDHLILGCRLIWALVPAPVVQACGEYCDVVTINYYEGGWLGRLLLWLSSYDSMRPKMDLTFKAFYDLAKKPLMVTEFSFRAMDSGMPNSYPPPILIQPNVKTQKQRADKFEECATTWMAQPYFVGYHWFQYMDEPKAGRAGDGENGNYGLVKIDDEPYTELTERLKAVNRRVWDLHK